MTSEILIVVGYLLYDQIRRSLTWALPFNLVSIEVNQKSMRTLYTLLNSLLSAVSSLSYLLYPLQWLLLSLTLCDTNYILLDYE